MFAKPAFIIMAMLAPTLAFAAMPGASNLANAPARLAPIINVDEHATARARTAEDRAIKQQHEAEKQAIEAEEKLEQREAREHKSIEKSVRAEDKAEDRRR